MKKLYEKIKKFFDDNSKVIKKQDYIIMGIFVLLYGILSFWNLGTNVNPQTFLEFEEIGHEATLRIDKGLIEISKIRHYSGDEAGSYQVLGSIDGVTYKEIGTFEDPYSFMWSDTEISGTVEYIKIVAERANTHIGEIQVYDKYGEKLAVSGTTERGELLVDEKNSVPTFISYLNSTYFDEIYFARSAYEYVENLNVIEWVHPPLGKLIQMLPIFILGMTTFAYRLMGNIAGILMIPVIYCFAKKMFKSRKYATLAACLMAFDTFHFAQTRMGTVDSFLVLFMMLAAYFMYCYLTLDKKATTKEKLVKLGLSGLFFGLATCVKWTGLYLGLGLCIMFFGKIIYDITKAKKKDKKEVINEYITICLGCLVFFIVIPAIIYCACYFLFPNVYPNQVTNLRELMEQIKGMFEYHANLNEPHPFSSKWYTWPLMLKPVWYYVAYPTMGMKSSIVGIGNPAIWWVGAVSIIYTLVRAIKKKEMNNIFIITLILSLWLPYAFIGRVMFLYHYFPVVPFMMLAIVGLIKMLSEKFKTIWFAVVYIAIVIMLFGWFYPVVSGSPISESYIESLQWLDSWVF